MFQLTAIFNRAYLDEVLLELTEREIPGITIAEVMGKGAYTHDENGKVELDRNIMITMLLADEEQKESAKEAIRSNTRDLAKGSGKMWVTPLLEVERIRTGETGAMALAQSPESAHPVHENYFTPVDTPAS